MAAIPCLDSSRIIIHFGMKPVRGGRPPRERSIKGIMEVRAGVFAQERVKELMLVASLILNVRKVAAVITKYVIRARNVREGENCNTRIIQPRWAIEEYARIFRSCVWFSPPQPPISVEVSPRKIMRFGLAGCICSRRANGASFCHVDIRRPVVRLSPCKTSGIHEWRGARPIFRARAIVIIVFGRGWDIWLMSHCPSIQAFVTAANMRVAAAVAWARKYFVVASIARGW